MSQLKPKSMASALILGALVGVGIWAGIASAMPQEGSDRGIVWKDGAEVYAGVCVYCHEQMLRGAGVDPAKIRYAVRHGKRAMPAFRSTEIDDASMEKLIEYLSKKEPEIK